MIHASYPRVRKELWKGLVGEEPGLKEKVTVIWALAAQDQELMSCWVCDQRLDLGWQAEEREIRESKEIKVLKQIAGTLLYTNGISCVFKLKAMKSKNEICRNRFSPETEWGRSKINILLEKTTALTSDVTVSSDGLTSTTVSRTSLLWYRVLCPVGQYLTEHNAMAETTVCRQLYTDIELICHFSLSVYHSKWMYYYYFNLGESLKRQWTKTVLFFVFW